VVWGGWTTWGELWTRAAAGRPTLTFILTHPCPFLLSSPPPAVYSRIKDTLDKEQWKAETGEEFEDSMGTVLNRKTYEDLARQGLL
jgi:hypothetical protein